MAARGADVTAAAGAPARASWTLIAPGRAAADLVAEVAWSDGQRENVTLTTERAGSIADMWLNGPFAATSARTFTTPGTRTATTVRVPGQAPVTATLTVTVT